MKFLGFELRRIQGASVKLPSGATGRNLFYYSPSMSVGELLANTTVASCVNIIADSVAILSCNVYEYTENGRERFDDDILSKLLRKAPNSNDTAFTFKQKVMLHLLLRGNAFIFVERGLNGRPVSLEALDPDCVQIKRDVSGEVYYEYRTTGGFYKYDTDHILHIPAIRYNSLRGLSPLEYATHAAKTGLELEEYTANYFDGGIHSKLILTAPEKAGKLTKEDAQALSEQLLSAYGGKDNANKPLILSNGFTATPLNLDGNETAQLVENRAFSEKEIAKIYRVPMFMLGSENSKFTNMEQSNTYFLQHTLTPWIVRLQQYFDRLLPEESDLYVEFDTNTLLRADYTARWNSYRENFKNGIFSLNQIMDLENLPRLEDEIGDKHFMQLNMTTIEKIANGENVTKDSVKTDE